MNDVKYGELNSDKIAAQNQVCREMVREIGTFGVNDRQRQMIIFLLALELEDVEKMKAIIEVVKKDKNELFVNEL